MTSIARAARFAVVSGLGSGVQLGVLASLLALGLAHPAATTAGVAGAVVHNYVWHRRWTWRDRATGPWLAGLGGFALANGLVSLIGNLAVMAVLVDGAGVAPVAAGVVAIAVCGLVNLGLADRVVFVSRAARHRRSVDART